MSSIDPKIDEIVNASKEANTLDLSSQAQPYTGLAAIPGSSPMVSAGYGNWNPAAMPINQSVVPLDPAKKVTIKVPGQDKLPTATIYDPDYVENTRTQAIANDKAKFGGQNTDKINEYYNSQLPQGKQKETYDQWYATTQGGTVAKKGFEGFLTQFLQIPQNQIGAVPFDVFGLKERAVTNPAFQKINPEAYNYENQRNAYAPQLKEALGANGLRLNIPEIDNMAKLLPSVSNDPQTNKDNVLTINSILYNRFGTQLGAQILQKYGITPDEVEARLTGSKAPSDPNGNQAPNSIVPPTGKNPPDNGTPGSGSLQTGEQISQDLINKYQSDSLNLANKAQIETDPQKKSDYLAQSRILDNMADDASQSPRVAPIMDTMAKIQGFLGNSEALPIANSLLLSPLGPAGVGLGAYVGKKEEQWLNAGGLEAFLPNQVKENEALKTGFTYGALDLLLFGAGKLLHPIKTVAGLRDVAATAATENGSKVLGNDIIKSVDDWAMNLKEVTPSMQDQAFKFADDVRGAYGGQEFSINDALAQKTASWGRGYTNAGIEGKPTVAAGERAVANAIKDQLPNTIKNYDKILSMMYSIKKPAAKVAKMALTGLGLGAGADAASEIYKGITGR